MVAIEAEGLRKEFPGEVVAVDGIDLTMREGEIFGFLGPNGAGKTTTVRMLTTLLRPTSGRASVAGFDVAAHPHEIRRRIGVALQEAGLDGMATGRGTRPAGQAVRAEGKRAGPPGRGTARSWG